MSDEWGPWIEHDGKAVPVPVGTKCLIENRNGMQGVIQVEGHTNPLGDCFIWGSVPPQWQVAEIVRDRIRKPREINILREIVANPPGAPFGEKPRYRLVPA